MPSQQVELVREQEQKKLTVLGEQLANLVNRIQGEKQQLQQLMDYQQDYRVRIHEQQSHWTIEKTQHYRNFCQQLESIIQEQSQKLNQSEEQYTQLQQVLAGQKNKIDVLDKVINRQRQALLVEESRRFQKDMDDVSLRQYRQ